MKLPVALQPWSAELALLPIELALAIGPWLQHLAAGIGPQRTRWSSKSGEVDGFGGLMRRGSFEHLSLASWLLADELPDEFLRRAAQNELLFLQPVRREPSGGSRSTVLFDAGPAQLGAPRLAHIALLFVLARRARQAASELEWGVLQDESCSLRALASQNDVRALLAARTLGPVDAESLERWRRLLESRPTPSELCVVAGTASSTAWLRPSLHIEVTSPSLGAVRVLDVSVHERDAPGASVRLDVPEPSLCVRLIRDPYRTERATWVSRSSPLDLRYGLLFSETGQHLIAALETGGVAVVEIPTSKSQSAPRVRELATPGELLLAARATRDEVSVITSDGARLWLRGDWPDTTWQGQPLPRELEGISEPAPLGSWGIRGGVLIFHRPGAGLFVAGTKEIPGLRVDADIVDVLHGRKGIDMLVRSDDRLVWSASTSDLITRTRRIHAFVGAREGCLGGGPSGISVAARLPDESWEVRKADGRDKYSVELPSRYGICGLIELGWGPHLIATAGPREVILLDGLVMRTIHRAASIIMTVACCAALPRIAIGTADGRVRVIDVSLEAELVHLEGKAP